MKNRTHIFGIKIPEKIIKYKKFLKFLFMWLISYSISMWVTYILREKMALSIFCSYLIALLVMNSINFMISLNMIFKNNYSHKTLYKYSISVVIIASINYALVSYFSIKFPELYLLIIFLVTTLLFFVKFFVYDKYVFTHKKVKLEEDIC